jgi:GIY-YIG catalytic domain
MFHFVYKTTNKINGKYYYGVHSSETLDDGYLGSGTKLRAAIRKYGKDNFERTIVALFEDRSEALMYEGSVVTPQLVSSPDCYNAVVGGNAPPKQDVDDLVTQRLKGNDRTPAQKKASEDHAIKMANRKAHNAVPIELFGVLHDSLNQALKYHKISPSHYYFMKNSGMHFNSAEELKQYTWMQRAARISEAKRRK